MDEFKNPPREQHGDIVGPIKSLITPRFAGFSTFCRLPRLQDVIKFDIALVGVPFDAGCTYRPGARMGPSAVREASRLVRPYNHNLQISPFQCLQVVDAGDIPCNPFNIKEAIDTIEEHATLLLKEGLNTRLICIGGDHTIALPLLRAVNKKFGRVALVHFDAHLDTWDTYFGEPYTHGTPFRRASEENLFSPDHSMHVGIRGPVYSEQDFKEDAEMGFKVIHAMDIEKNGVQHAVERIKNRVGNNPLYISIDIDVLDPAFAPGTGTPEIGGFTTRELQRLLHGLKGLNIVGADVVEVSPAYDHAQLTSIAAASVAYELVCLMALSNGLPRHSGAKL